MRRWMLLIAGLVPATLAGLLMTSTLVPASHLNGVKEENRALEQDVERLKGNIIDLRAEVEGLSSALGETQSALAETEAEREVDQALRVIDQAVHAFNTGDGEAWWEARAQGSYFPNEELREQDRAGDIEFVRKARAAGSTAEMRDCVYEGFGDVEGLADEGLPTARGHHFRCKSYISDDLLRPAGLYYIEDYDWVIADGQVVAVGSDMYANPYLELITELNPWLAANRPETYWELGNYWWDDLYEGIPIVAPHVHAFVDASPNYPLPDELDPPDPAESGTVAGVRTFNADENQRSLLAWALARFDEVGLGPPAVDRLAYPPARACRQGLSGQARFSGLGTDVDLCIDPGVFDEQGTAPLTARRTALHELAHVWNHDRLDEATTDRFLVLRGLADWHAGSWEESGTEQAAEILAWGLAETWTIARVPGATCESLLEAWAVLTDDQATPRSDDCSSSSVEYRP